MTIPAKEQRRINRKRAKIMRAVDEGYHLRAEIEQAIGIGYLSNVLGNMVKAGMLHTKPELGARDKNGNHVQSYWSGQGEHVPEPDIDDGMQCLLDAWPIPKPQTDTKAKVCKLTDERHNDRGLSCNPGVNMQSSMG